MNENGDGLDPAFTSLLAYLKTNRGFDFGGYKRSSLERRMRRRMSVVHLDDFATYEEYLKSHTREFEFLFNTIQINITSFFRDKPTWDHLAEVVIPAILASRSQNETLRIWSAGCASGEEPCTIAMLFAEALGLNDYRERVKIYATDVDESALAQARAATYDAEMVKSVPPGMLEKYFERVNGQYLVRSDLRRLIIFGRNDLMQDAPISRLDLLVCRNTLIYFNRDAQKRILSNFHFALRDSGFLFLGKAEMLLTHADQFKPIHARHRIFTRVVPSDLRSRFAVQRQDANDSSPDRLNELVLMQDAAFNAGPTPELVISHDGDLVMANEQARQVFGLNQNDLGRPFRDLEVSYHPAELRSLIQRAREEKRAVLVENVQHTLPEGPLQHFNVRVIPLAGNTNRWLGTHVIFSDISDRIRLEGELEKSRREVQTAYEQLQSTNEELETSNEELQSAVEELQTTNEELQSTNEEMETVNEELQSTNAELQTTNDELRVRTIDAGKASAFLESILDGLDVGVVVVDQDFKILMWNRAAEELWGLRAAEVHGQSLVELDIGLPVEDLKKPMRTFWDSGDLRKKRSEPVVLEAVNRRGKPIRVRVTLTMQTDTNGDPLGMVLLMEKEGA